MISFLLAALVAVGNVRLAASQSQQTTWGTVVMTLHGEATPAIADAYPRLTQLGALQLLAAGAALRTRYIQGLASNITGSFPIAGLSTYAIDNSQLQIVTADDDYTSASAQAFMQGLYPPLGVLYTDNGALLGNGILVEYPLNGYQYPTIDTISGLDFNYVWISGDTDCNEYMFSASTYSSSDNFHAIAAASNSLYQKLIPVVFHDVLPKSLVNYYNAYNLWEYANNQYIHNSAVYNTMAASDLQQLRYLASQYEFSTNGNLTAFGLQPGDMIRAVAGRTYAGHVHSLLGQIMGSHAKTRKMNLLFGRYPVFLSFFALSGLSNLNDNFKSLPEPGSVMVFELFSNTANATTFPDAKDLWVRFLFRNGTESTNPLIAYPLFGRGNSAVDMTWNDFQTGMNGIEISDLGTWCETCASNALYCPQFESNLSGGSNSTSGNGSTGAGSASLSPVIAGVVGAVVTIAVLMLLFAAAFICFGLRLYRNASKRQSTLGGFKGAEKLASDTDLTIAKNPAGASVARHERVGSWELSEADKKKGDIEEGRNIDRVVSTADYSGRHDEDQDSIVESHAEPMKADDQV